MREMLLCLPLTIQRFLSFTRTLCGMPRYRSRNNIPFPLSKHDSVDEKDKLDSPHEMTPYLCMQPICAPGMANSA